ncbi:MAG: putative DNA-binding transcriptional regulator YafY [Oleiphilaceae bacterium]|jgi:predicted DNA-binding transcriptional regulator YafY
MITRVLTNWVCNCFWCTRNLDALKGQGYPIETDQGRGGGARLYARWGIGRLALNYQKVIDLLLALSVLEKCSHP